MTSSRKLEVSIFVIAVIILAVVWAINGYDDTWLYVTAVLIILPTFWYYSESKNKGQ